MAEYEKFLNNLGQAVDLVNKQDIAALEMRQNTDQVTAFFKRRSGGMDQRYIKLIGDNMGKRCLAQAGRP